MSYRETGSSLLELLVAMTISVIVLATIVTATRDMVGAATQLRQRWEDVIVSTRIAGLVANGLRVVELTRARGLVRLSMPNTFTLASGRLHPLVLRSNTTAPRSDSTILSVLEPMHDLRSTLVRAELRGSRVHLEACTIAPRPFDSSLVRSVVIFTPSGVVQLAGSVFGRNGPCFRVDGSPIDSMFGTKLDGVPPFGVLYLVSREYSMYVDRSSQLRYAGHVGARILELQPVARGIRSVTIEPVQLSTSVLGHRVTVRRSSNRFLKWMELPILSPRGVWASALY